MKKIFIALFFLFTNAVFAEDGAPVTARLTPNHEIIMAGQEFKLLLDVKLESGWHAYWKNPGDSGMAPSFEWTLPEGLTVTHTDWPTPERFEAGDATTYGYSNEIPFLITVKASDVIIAQTAEISCNVHWIVCSSETCLPGLTQVKTQIQVGTNSKKEISTQARFDEIQEALPKTLANHSLKHTIGSVIVSFPDEIALNDTPQFFPENPDYKRTPKLLGNKKGIEFTLPEKNGEALKGVLVLGSKAYSVDLPSISAEKEAPLTFVWALFFAFIGGLILNLMPCVLPVVSLKVMSFVKMAGNSRKEMIKQGVAFTLGVLVSFWALAAALIGLQATGQAVGWGFQLQDPFFIAALALLFTFLALNLFGVFEIGTSIASIAGEASQGKPSSGYKSSFSSGIFATAVATPCTGPFMGSALGYALTQPAYISFIVFTALGLGMSLPYLLIGFFPSLIKWVPKPGPWMESVKQFLGFVMLSAVIWLLWVFNGQTSELGLFLLLFALLLGSIGGWIYGRFGALHRSKTSRKTSYWLTAFAVMATLGIAKIASGSVSDPSSQENAHHGWEPFSAEKVAALRETRKPILIDFTAKWCLVCQANHLVMTHHEVAKKFQEHGITLMKADWTRYDPVITEALKKYGRSGVPLYVLYGAKEEPIILPQILTPDAIISAIEATNKTYVR